MLYNITNINSNEEYPALLGGSDYCVAKRKR